MTTVIENRINLQLWQFLSHFAACKFMSHEHRNFVSHCIVVLLVAVAITVTVVVDDDVVDVAVAVATVFVIFCIFELTRGSYYIKYSSSKRDLLDFTVYLTIPVESLIMTTFVWGLLY